MQIRKTKFKSVFESDEKTKQKPKFKSPFQSAAKTKNEKRNSNPFFSVTSRQKTKNRNGNGIPFYKAEEKRKIKMKFECLFFYAIEKRLALRYTHLVVLTFCFQFPLPKIQAIKHSNLNKNSVTAR